MKLLGPRAQRYDIREMPTTAIILNAGSGSGAAEAARDVLEATLAGAGHAVRTTLATSGDAMQAAIATAVRDGVDCVVAGGGDGTISTAAALLAGSKATLGVVPLGTLNHFAKDLGIPLDAQGAADVIRMGQTVDVDVGEVNGEVFVNNSSLGAYPLMVRLRAQHPARGMRKWAVAAWAAAKVAWRDPVLRVRIRIDDEPEFAEPVRLVFIGNNSYRMAGLDAGARDSLTDGTLSLHLVKARGRRRATRLAWRIVRGTAEELEEFEIRRGREITVTVERPRVLVARDGEVQPMEPPLAYRIRPGALRVFAPAAGQRT